MHNLAVSYSYSYQASSSSSSGLNIFFILACLVLVVVMLGGMWKMFTKAGHKGWKCIIPVYNYVIMWRMVGKSGWNTLWFLVPFAGAIFEIILFYKLAKAFGHGVGMTILCFVGGIGFLIMGFGKSKYLGPNGGGGAGVSTGTGVQPQPPVAPVAPAPPAAAV